MKFLAKSRQIMVGMGETAVIKKVVPTLDLDRYVIIRIFFFDGLRWFIK